jgi:hypothetical protein
MKKVLFLHIAILGFYLCSIARPVDQETAQNIAAKFMETSDLQLAATYRTERGASAFHVFNTADGFVIVSADDCETPIIGYSHNGHFDPNNVPIQMEDYLHDFIARIQYGIENHIEADEATAKQWEMVKTTGKLNDSKSTKAVAPLLTDKWNQGCLYNSLCPTMSGPCGHAEVGCVAVAMAQIMRYWGYPTTGWGTHSYTNAGLTLSADFGNTTYDWEHMPDSLTENSSEAEIEAVSTLLYHCGVSLEMRYGPNGSLANTGDVINALRRYFNYTRQIHKEKKSDYSNEEWSSLLMNSLDLSRPIQYVGYGSGGHSFVCDGYDSNGLFHFNWGWGTANGYFALGNLNPLGYDFSISNAALFDIIPQYEPCVVNVSVFPPGAGTFEGNGEYHIGELCTLTASPAEGYNLYCWKKDGQTMTNNPTYTFAVENDTVNIEVVFCCSPVGQITASYSPEANNPNCTSVSLSWNQPDTEWALLKQFDLHEEGSGVATDGEHIYVTYAFWNTPPFSFGKYTMDGVLVEQFNIRNDFDAGGLDYDGTSFYCNTSHSGLQVLYQVDLDNKMIIDSLNILHWFGDITYGPEYDGFWLDQNYQAALHNRQGQKLQASPTVPDYIFGTGYYTAKDGSPHLLITRESGVFDYNITNNSIFDSPLLDPGWDYTYGMGACTGKYDGKDAMFIANDHSILIYEIKSRLEQIIGYRIYRADSEGNTVMLADNFAGSSYIDETWGNALAGEYKFGISEVFANGFESEIIWSNAIMKTDFVTDENLYQPEGPSVQKVIENGHIVIIKDGKRYTLTGQQLN